MPVSLFFYVYDRRFTGSFIFDIPFTKKLCDTKLYGGKIFGIKKLSSFELGFYSGFLNIPCR